MRSCARTLGVAAILALLGPWARAETQGPDPPVPPPLALPRAAAAISVDGDLSDPGWQGAAVIDTFYETVFGDNRPPTVKTVAWITYDDRYLYIGLRCDDPDPGKIRAPYVDRDNVFGTDDNVAVFLDTRNDRRSAVELRVNPRGIQGDAIFNDANGNEDFSPDFYYDTAARITEAGWQAEMRVPLSSLRYPKTDPQSWGILVWRNYPRDYRYAIYSSPQPRGANCLICHSRALTGIHGLPSSSHLVVAPYASGQDVARAPAPGEPLGDSTRDGNVGLDLKWGPTADTALDATINPDFSQIEADTAQIAVNNRFALFYPEKRPFFLEGTDLFDTPLQAVYTRTITSPRWGGRATGKIGASSYTVLLSEDRGGGSVILPGPTGSGFAPQDFESLVGVARWRRDLGGSFVGLLYTGRELDGPGYNRVFGPDVQWRPNERETVAVQFLWSESRTPERPDLAEEWDGRRLSDHALYANWAHRTRTVDWGARYMDVGDAFRADEGFISKVGYRQGRGNLGYSFYPSKSLFSYIRPYFNVTYEENRQGRPLDEVYLPGIFVLGRRNLQAELDFVHERQRTGDALLSKSQVFVALQVDPSRRFTRIGMQVTLGEEIDVANVRVGDGVTLNAYSTLRPTDHLTLDLNAALSWLDLKADEGGGRVFTAWVGRAKANYNFSPRLLLRLIGQYISEERDPDLWTFPVTARSGAFSGSALLSYRINWQTAVFVGYGDDRALDPRNDLKQIGRQFFAKISYSFQR